MTAITPRTLDFINAQQYPLDQPNSPARADVVRRVREELAATGCSVLRDFIAPDELERLVQEGDAVAPSAYYDSETVNVYNTDPDPSLPADHPARVAMERGNAFVARDRIPPETLIHRLYASDEFRCFLADCFDKPELHQLADPLSGLVLNVVVPGNEHPWHFDVNEFTVSMLVQAPQDGGVFEYCPGIRSPQDENFTAVSDVINGRGDQHVKKLHLRTGDLQLFQGRYSLHRVTEVQGEQPRHTAIFAYSGKPGVVGSPTRTRQLFGRLTPAHTAVDPHVRAAPAVDPRIDALMA